MRARSRYRGREIAGGVLPPASGYALTLTTPVADTFEALGYNGDYPSGGYYPNNPFGQLDGVPFPNGETILYFATEPSAGTTSYIYTANVSAAETVFQPGVKLYVDAVEYSYTITNSGVDFVEITVENLAFVVNTAHAILIE